ncbi:MAG: hypothetical protein JWQ66_2095 [Mucilaginibacter sp.]|nr:hypothetical protein [Mucilaginibacter sp.]
MSNFLNVKELKEQASITDLLSKLGYKSVKKYGREQFYYSMLRESDTKPSFSVNEELGVWFDHGTRKGGNIVDFGLAYWKQLGFNEVIEKLQEICSLTNEPRSHRPRRPVKIPHYIIEETKDLGTHPAITDYLKGRGVFEVAKSCLSEVYYYVEDAKGLVKHFFAAGWLNENQGWEVRNKYFKGCLGRKAISVIPGHPKNAALFEGFINYLSWRTENPLADQTIIVLNTLALLSAGIAKAKEFSSVDVFFDRDQSGLLASKELVKALPYATDRAKAYDGFNDYNDKIVSDLKLQPEFSNPVNTNPKIRI